MKTLKFYPHLVKQIIEGEKTSTWRLFDDKDLRENDVVSFINKETGEVFGRATITSLIVKTFGTLKKTIGWVMKSLQAKRRCMRPIGNTMVIM